MGVGAERKQAYFNKLTALFDQYPAALLISCDNVGSSHLQSIRKELRKYNAVMLMGKNTMIKKALKQHAVNNPKLESLVPWISGNIGFIFCQSADLQMIVKICKTNRVAAAAKPGTNAPSSVVVPAGPTGMEPTMTSFLQALNIATKINKGQIEIIQDVEILREGQRIGNSEAALLQKLNIKPFTYGLQVNGVYDNGAVFEPHLLEITEDFVVAKFKLGVLNVAKASLSLGIPTVASVPHLLLNGYKNVMSVAVATDYSYPQVEKLKDRIKNPGAYAVAAAPVAAAPAPAAAAAGKKEKEPEKKPAKKEESSEEMGFGLFD